MDSLSFKRILSELNSGRSAVLSVPTAEGAYTRAFIPDDRMILLGGGHVSLALARMACMLDFSITVVDDRPAFANAERFPMADRVICDSFAHAIDELGIRSSDYVCVLTRGHQWDTVCAEKILSGKEMPYYFGMIGSHRRVEGLTASLIEQGYDSERLSRLHAPIGLSIGGVTPAEIAVSICAEMIQCRRERPITFGGDVMTHMNADMRMIDYLADGGEPRAMILVLGSDGSTPVKSGAMMAVNTLGQGYGTVGGGCGEAAAITHARRIIGTGGSRILELDMSDDAAADHGMVCGGTMRILIEDITEV